MPMRWATLACVSPAYRPGSGLKSRRALMQDWAGYLTTKADK